MMVTSLARMELGLNKKLVRIGLRDTFVHGAGKEYLMKEYGLDAMALVKAIEEITGVSTGITESRLAAVRVTAVHSEAKAEAL